MGKTKTTGKSTRWEVRSFESFPVRFYGVLMSRNGNQMVRLSEGDGYSSRADVRRAIRSVQRAAGAPIVEV
jgi:uncharacterized protein YegP (UPF0339 family)